MKTSILITVLIFLNTTALISEPIANLIKGIDSFWLIVIEILLLLGYYINNQLKDLNSLSEVDLSNLKFYVFTNQKSK